MTHASAAQAIKVKTIPSTSLIFKNNKNNKEIHKRLKRKKETGQTLNKHKVDNYGRGKNKKGNKSLEYLMRIVQINIKCMSKAKAELISHMFYNADIMALQETHIPDDRIERLKIPGFQLIDFIGHNKYGVETFVNLDLNQKGVKRIEGNKHTVDIEVGNTKMYNVYKPPTEDWTTPVLPQADHPAVYIKHFNSHSTEWGYSSEDSNKDNLSNWTELNYLHLLNDAKQGGTFK